MTTALLLLATLALPAQQVRVETIPAQPVLERHRTHLSLQCDFRITNGGATPVSLDELVLLERDDHGELMRRRFANWNGTAPSIVTVIDGPVPAGEMIHIFNPFHHFEVDGQPGRLEFQFHFRSGGERWVETVAFAATVYRTRTALRIPLDGRLMVTDGHDFLSHHRRIGLDHPVVRTMGLNTNTSRYASDLVVLGPNGAERRGEGTSREDWHTWDAPVLAPGAGRVVALENDFPDNVYVQGRVAQDPRISPRDPTSFAGNYVALDHGNGEFSVLGHLRRGSVSVEVDQQVAAGDPLGTVGLSGSTTHVHLHYQLQDSADLFGGVGLPNAFTRYRLHRGGTSRIVRDAPIDTGEIVEHVEGSN